MNKLVRIQKWLNSNLGRNPTEVPWQLGLESSMLCRLVHDARDRFAFENLHKWPNPGYSRRQMALPLFLKISYGHSLFVNKERHTRTFRLNSGENFI